MSAALRCDLVFNLRYPTNGETSAALIQAMGLEKPCVVTDIGWFSEIPDDAVIKVPFDIMPERLIETIECIIYQDISQMVRKAKEYVDIECASEGIASSVLEFIKNAQGNNR